MPTLQVEDVSEDVLNHLRTLAAQRQVTVSEQARRLIEGALRGEDIRAREAHSAALAELRQRRWTPPAGTPDSVDLLREDRER